MNDLEEAFNQITTIKFLIEMLQKAVTANDTERISKITDALDSFYYTYCDNWDQKFKDAWDHTVKTK